MNHLSQFASSFIKEKTHCISRDLLRYLLYYISTFSSNNILQPYNTHSKLVWKFVEFNKIFHHLVTFSLQTVIYVTVGNPNGY